MYHVLVHSLAGRALTHIRKQEVLSAGDRVGVAVSGGIDSVALLRLLLELRGELGIVLSVVHFNHRLRGAESDADQEFVWGRAREFELEFFCDGDDTARFAAEEKCSVETAARELRYRFYHRLLLGAGEPQGLKPESLLELNGTSELVPFPSVSPTNSLNTICTGHTLDDQAETVLMRVIRGTGLRGLGAIHPRLAVEDQSGELCGEIVRPLLGFRRAELEAYLRKIGQSWREDASNFDNRFTRNRVRHSLLPLIEREFNPSVAENLSELAEIARGEEDYWDNEAAGWMGRTVHWAEPEWVPGKSNSLTQRDTGDFTEGHARLVQIDAAPTRSDFDSELEFRIDSAPWLVVNGSVNRRWLLGEPLAVQRRVIKAMGEHVRLPLEFKHIEEILQFAAEDGETGKGISLPLGWKIVRHPEELVLMTPDLRQRDESAAGETDYEYDLPVPGCVLVKEAHATYESQRISVTQEQIAADSGQLLDAEALPGPLRVRNWRPGDRFWPAHTKEPKKIKELLQGRTAGSDARKLWPVISSGDVIVWVRGFPVPAKFRTALGREAVLIVERALGGHLPDAGRRLRT
ncbi:MAG: tRNA lysidine(34) synthetase TilS [Candidatus Sulfotelmatobacter sp.]